MLSRLWLARGCRAAPGRRVNARAAGGGVLPVLSAPEGCAALRLAQHAVAAGPGRTLAAVLPADEEAVLELYVSLGRLDADPYWASLWPSTHALAYHLLNSERGAALVHGRRVLELGCGAAALAGVAAALAGARHVTLADREPRALLCALHGAAANGLAVAPLSPRLARLAGVTEGAVVPPGAAAEGAAVVSAAAVDWHDLDSAPGGIDVVLACDVLYEEESVAPVAALAPRMLAPGGTFVLADPPTRTPHNRKRFLELTAGAGAPFALTEEGLHQVVDASGMQQEVNISVLTRE